MFEVEFENSEYVMNKKIELAKEALRKSRKVGEFYKSQYGIDVDNVHRDAMFIDVIIHDGVHDKVFTKDEVARALYPEKYQKKSYEIEGYDCVEMIVDAGGKIKWVGDKRPGWNGQFPPGWRGHSFKLIRISEEPDEKNMPIGML